MLNMENMKEQTFGVEIEMNSITRENAAVIASQFFGTGRYADTHSANGYRAWSAWDEQGREWKFVYDSSISAWDESEKCEMVTPICKYEDIEQLQELVRVLRRHGAKSDYTRGCGVHIHIGAKGHTPESLRSLVNLMATHEATLITSLEIDEGRLSTYCKVVEQELLDRLNNEKPDTMEKFADVWYEANDAEDGRIQHYNISRYHMLNLHATFTKGTIEFRLFQFLPPEGDKQNGLHAGRLKAYIQFCMALSEAAKEKTYSFRRKNRKVEENKRVMKFFLNDLFGEDEEFATARNLFKSNLLWPRQWRERFSA